MKGNQRMVKTPCENDGKAALIDTPVPETSLSRTPPPPSSPAPAVYQFGTGHSMVREVPLTELEDSQDNHFRRMEGDRWEAFVGSIREYGVVSPLIIRPKAGQEGRYEILAGHNRRTGAAEAGLATVPCIAVDVDDVDASVLIGITNRQREEVTDLEWGWTYRTTLERIKRQGACPQTRDARQLDAVAGTEAAARDGNAEMRAAGKDRTGSGEEEMRTAGERSVDIVARKFGVNRKTVQRKIRLTYLVPQLYELGRQKKYPQQMMVDLSYLPPAVQINVVQAVVIEGSDLTERETRALRAVCREDLTIEDVLRICRQDIGKEGSEAAAGRYRRVKYYAAEELFPAALPKCRRQAYVTAALEYIRDRKIELPV